MEEQYSRALLLFGEEAMNRIRNSRVAVFGLGGVGGAVLEALARSGTGALDLIDNDSFAESNLNRQILSTREVIGRDKADVAEERVRSIDPSIRVRKYKCFFLPETAGEFDFSEYDYVVDAIDTVTGKLQIIEMADKAGIPVISVMGCGNRMDPARLKITDISETSMDPLSRVMRRELKKRGIRKLQAVWSDEPPLSVAAVPDPDSGRRSIPGSTAFVPPAAGFLAASKVIRDLIG